MQTTEKKIQALSLPDIIAADLRSSIVSGDIRPGEALRQEEIAAQFDTSRIPVREALRRLQSEGLVTFHPHKGVLVSVLSAKDVRELFEIRIMLEPPALRLAISQMTEATIEAASSILDRLDGEASPSPIGSLNRDFHMTIYGPACRPQLLEMIAGLYAKTDRYGHSAKALSWYQQVTQNEHRALLAACDRRDADGASTLLVEHIESFGNRLVEAQQ